MRDGVHSGNEMDANVTWESERMLKKEIDLCERLEQENWIVTLSITDCCYRYDSTQGNKLLFFARYE